MWNAYDRYLQQFCNQIPETIETVQELKMLYFPDGLDAANAKYTVTFTLYIFYLI